MLKHIQRSIAAALVAGSTVSLAQTTEPRTAATTAGVAWMEGSWISVNGRRTVEEHWTSPAGGALLAVSRTLVDGRLAEFEFLRIVERDGTLIYVAQPSGRPPTEFAMTRLDDRSVTFENPQHDFPKTIRYEKRADGSLMASIAGAGNERMMSWVFVSKAGSSR